MSIHKLTAGSGYDYLTRQVAALDATEKGRTGLASYYTERGESSGVWVGSGMAGIGGLNAGDVVTAEQMRALFGSGLHPLAVQRQGQLQGPDLPETDYQTVMRLGLPFKVHTGDVSPFRVEVATRIAALNEAAGLPGDWPVPAGDRARIRTEVAREFFAAEHGRQPTDARELAGTIARHSRPRTRAVAGYDLTFSPVKSVSALWAVAEPAVAAAVERAHQAAVSDALRFLEQHALFTRTGTNGVRQVDVQGMVATAFTHRDSRAGDPDLHTHVAVANKVQTLDGRWLSIDGRVLFKATVAASETYNTAVEQHLRDGLGVRFEERPNPDGRLRPVREIVGVHAALNQRWSARRAAIDTRRGELAAAFQRDHGRPPTPVEALQLAQRANLETREAKHEPRSLADQRATWHREASQVLGGPAAVRAMVRGALSPDRPAAPVVDVGWVSRAAGQVLSAMEERRSTWQVWHVRAEAQRRVRGAQVPTDRVEQLVDLLVADVLHDRSMSLARPADGIAEPSRLRRSNGSSVYTVAGAELFTSARVLAAEQRLVAAAGRRDGHTVDPTAVTMALLESTANGITLNAGQVALVREMATSGARVQLAIAPAGTGKTTAMQALARAWTEGGGAVVGLAPSAAAAAVLGDQLRTPTDTVAKLTWSLQHADPPAWVQDIGPSTLVVVDEAGMADTLSLDTVVAFVVGRGGSVRLVGDDQQLAAIGAGGVLRDIHTTHGAVRLTELLRFTDPAEGAASLALRDGRTEALGFYLDHHRVHVGDLSTMTEDVFSAWQADRDHGLDSIMLAPTRDLVAELNRRARAHRLNHPAPGHQPAGRQQKTVTLGDGNPASVGDLVITRTNHRRLRVSATDWVKNGDRWTILGVTNGGDLQVQHIGHGRTVRLPAGYVNTAVELGYATTVHTAQGVSADTMHGLAGGDESRQQLYTMMTRGRTSNHLYLQVVGDGDPHTVITPGMVHPPTPTDLLEQILARDHTPRSATTLQRDQHNPAVRLGEATCRYLDALHVAAEAVAGPELVQTLDGSADRILPGLTEEPAWPTLRAHLLLHAAQGADPIEQLQIAATKRELGSAGDRAAVLDCRVDDPGHRSAQGGPLSWLPAVPDRLAAHRDWGPYLGARAALVTVLASQVREDIRGGRRPGWADQTSTPVPAAAVEDAAVWRAAMQIPAEDRRPTGPLQLGRAARTHQQRLDRAVAGERAPAWQEWGRLIEQAVPGVHRDDFRLVLADRLAAISRAGLDARGLLQTAVQAGAVPDDHGAAALWWRISRHLTPPVAAEVDHLRIVTTSWTPRLVELLGADQAEALQASRWWPPLVTAVDQALHRGWRLEDLVSQQDQGTARTDGGDIGQDLVWRISLLSDLAPTDDLYEPFLDPSPEDLRQQPEPLANQQHTVAREHPEASDLDDPLPVRSDRTGSDLNPWVEPDLAVAAMIRDTAGPPEQTDTDVARMFTRAVAWQESPVTRERMLAVNQLTWDFFRDQFPHFWGRPYLAGRFRQDLIDDPTFPIGQAPPGWSNLVHHLRRRGVTDQEMTVTGVATLASTGRLIDRFRDRVIFSIVHDGDILGFVGRRHPHLTDTGHGGPKYLNTPDTPLFHKGAQLFCATEQHLDDGGIPVIAEGPMDAIAVTLATHGRYVGVAPLGTSLTDEQAAQLARIGTNPIVATDGDPAGQVAAERHFWILTPHRLDPGHAQLPQGTDPAELLTSRGNAVLSETLAGARPLGARLLDERLGHLPPDQARPEALRVLAARPSDHWKHGTHMISQRLQVPFSQIRKELLGLVKEWNDDPRQAARKPLQDSKQVAVRNVLARRTPHTPAWSTLANQLDPRLPDQEDWPALTNLLQSAAEQGHDVDQVTRQLVAKAPLNQRPAQDLRYRLIASLGIPIDDNTLTTTQRVDRARPQQARPEPPPSPERASSNPRR